MDSKLKEAFEKGITTKPAQAKKNDIDTITYNAPIDIRHIEFNQRINGPASFVHVEANQPFQIQWKNMQSGVVRRWFRNILPNVPFILQDENVIRMKVTPAAYPCIFSFYASRDWED